MAQERLAGGGRRVSRLPPLEQREACRLLQRRHPTRRGGLAHLQGLAGAERAPGPRDGEEEAQIVPAQHGIRHSQIVCPLASCIFAEPPCNIADCVAMCN